jgi:hypothetical protein
MTVEVAMVLYLNKFIWFFLAVLCVCAYAMCEFFMNAVSLAM